MKHALIVDDDVDSASSLKMLIASENFSVAVAHTLRDARRQIALQQPDIVLLDLRLPDGSGMDLFSDPQLCARRQFRVRRHPEMGDHAYCFPGFDLAEVPGDVVGPAPCVGADNDFVFRDLVGLSEAEYASYRQQGVFD